MKQNTMKQSIIGISEKETVNPTSRIMQKYIV